MGKGREGEGKLAMRTPFARDASEAGHDWSCAILIEFMGVSYLFSSRPQGERGEDEPDRQETENIADDRA